MKTKLLSLCLALFYIQSYSQTSVPDDNFEHYLETHDVNGIEVPLGDSSSMGDGDETNNSVPTSKISGVTSLDVSGLFISDMTGIEDFAALQTLNCSSNNLNHLDLFSNTFLTDINCNDNNIGNSGGQLILPDNNTLTSLRCGNNNLSSLDVSSYPLLEYLSCYLNNPNSLTNLDFSSNTALVELYCHSSGVSSLNITGCSALQKMWCYGNPLNTLNISTNTELIELSCYSSNIGTLNFSNNIKLIKIVCDDNPLGSIDVSMLPDLEWLWCWNTGLTELDVSSNLALKRLDFGGNSITTGQLMLPNTDTIEYLWGYDNLLTGTINTSPYTNLINMDFTWNSLTSIDVSSNTALTDLWVGDNNLSTIDVSNNPLIEDFDCWKNNLSGDLDVSMLTVLDRFWCYDNQLSNINAKNTNNAGISVFNTTLNTSSLCIQVDNKAYADGGPSGWSKDASASYEEICSGLSTNEFNLLNISIYPNPVKDKIYIELQVQADFTLTNIFGQEVLRGELVSGNNELATKSLANGLYILNLETPEGKFTKKLIKN